MTKDDYIMSLDAAYREGLEAEKNADVAAQQTGAFQDVLTAFITWLQQKDFLEAAQRPGAAPKTLRIQIWPKFRPTESTTIFTLWIHQVSGRDAVSVLGQGETEFTDPKQLQEYLIRLLKGPLAESMKEIHQRYDADADGMLRADSPGRMTMDDVSIVIPRDDFLRLAQANPGDPVTVRVDVAHNKRFDIATSYKFLTSSGHVLQIKPNGVTVNGGVVEVNGLKQASQRLAA